MAAAMLFSAGVVIAALALGSAYAVEARIAVAAAAAAILSAWLAAAIGNVARLRFFSPTAIDAGGVGGDTPDDNVRQASAILQNTLEQVVLAIPLYDALALLVDRSVPVIAACVGLFSAGRMLFWAGYGRGAAGRAMGFALTFYPNIAALLIVLGTVAANMLR